MRSEQVHGTHELGCDRLFKVTINKSMTPFKGRLAFKQHMKDKPVKFGIKVFVLSDSHNGYVYRLQVYTGKNLDSVSNAGLCTSSFRFDVWA